MLNPRRSGVNRPSIPSRLGTSQKKYTSHSASPNANRTLSPALDRPPRRIVASLSKSKPLTYLRCCRGVERLDLASANVASYAKTPATSREMSRLCPLPCTSAARRASRRDAREISHPLVMAPCASSACALKGEDFDPETRARLGGCTRDDLRGSADRRCQAGPTEAAGSSLPSPTQFPVYRW